MVIAALAAVLLAALVAAGAALAALRAARAAAAPGPVPADAPDPVAAAVEAAVAAVVEQAQLTLGVEREAVVRSAVDTVLAVASDKLGDTVAAGTRELDLRNQRFEKGVADVGQRLEQLGNLVTSLQTQTARQHGALQQGLEAVTRTSAVLAEQTQQIGQVLASPKARGQWGERMAEDVLRAAGMRPGINYRRQTAIAGGTIPDFAFLLPNDLEVRMDVKFPVDNFVRAVQATTEADRATATKAFVRDARARIKELAGRDYASHTETVDCVLLFIPNEAVYAALHEADAEVVDFAMGQQVVLCSPSTLFAVLAVIRRSVEQFQLERTSHEILRCLSGVEDQWQRFSNQLDAVSKRLDTLTAGFGELTGVRRRQLEKAFGEVDRLRREPARAVLVAESGEEVAARRAAGDVRALPLEPTLLDPPEVEAS